MDKISQIQFTEAEKKNIKDRYFNILYNNVTNEQFSKIQEANSEAYKLTLKGEEIKNIVNKVFEILKNDKITLGKIEEICGIKASDIEKQIQNLNSNEKINKEIFVITIYNQNGNVSKIIFENSEYKILLEKILYGNQLNYTLTIEFIEENIKNIIKASFEGLQTNQNIKESYEIEILKTAIVYKYAYRSSINFNNNVQIEDFNEENSIILSNYNTEQVSGFIKAVSDRIEEVNKQQMEELNFEKNPLGYILTPFIPEHEETSVEINEMEINTFNNKFELYTSNGLKGVTVKGLISTISLNNETMNEDRKIKEINFNGEEYEATETNLETIKTNIDKEAEYRIEFEKMPETGLIYRAIINLK